MQSTERVIKVLVGISTTLLGLSFFFGANTKAVSTLLEFYQLHTIIIGAEKIIGAVFVLFAVTVCFSKRHHAMQTIAVISGLFIAIIPLLSLLSASRWIAAEGGFPVIGSGQGIIKYAALIPLLLFLFYKQHFSNRQLIWLNVAPVVMVLVWIGGMKFLRLEAEAIAPLISSSPFMSWLYDLFDIMTTSYLIGVYDIVFAFALMVGIYLSNRILFFTAFAACFAVFITTQTFLFSMPNALSADTVLTGVGQFVIKDLWFIANMLVIYSLTKSEMKNSR
ncbi:YkgB family protein [Aestuariibacter sp. AA17]|uniref:YkgB family protein n=1 Tax=Fluctibacter corallii TaxID=2984329 RepID=A0ABT3A5I2_9ALTE|nr:YkgB family protein [Aestuariibacter sp. AA17]MCV2883873.1 YkgB family protein [Aestuariibacter sp. AA17]